MQMDFYEFPFLWAPNAGGKKKKKKKRFLFKKSCGPCDLVMAGGGGLLEGREWYGDVSVLAGRGDGRRR